MTWFIVGLVVLGLVALFLALIYLMVQSDLRD